MPSSPHSGFARLLASEKRQGGLVQQQTFDRLLCTGANIEVFGDKFNARVVVTHTFVNQLPGVTQASLGFRVDPAWQVTLLRIDTIDGKFLLSQQNVVSDSQDKNKGGVPVSFTSNEHITATSDIVSCDLPWALLSGQTVTTTLEFICPIDVSNADESVFRVPSFVSVYDPVFAQQSENNSNTWKGKFALLSTPVAPSASSVVAKNTLRIRGQLCVPWAAPANSSAAAAKVKATFSQSSTTYKDLANYGSIRFEFEASGAGKNVSDSSSSLISGDFFSATLTRPAVVKDATVAIESVTVAHDERAAASEQVAVALSLAPNIANINPNKLFPNVEVIFLVDTSSDCVSQWGPRVREALTVAVRGLATDSMFNVVSYGDSVVRAFDRSRYVDEQSLDVADNFINGAASPLSRGLGRRKLFDAISTVFTEPCVAGYARTVVVLTNGGCDASASQQETLRSRVIDLVASNSSVATILAVALGKTADSALLKSMVKWSAAGSEFRSVAQRFSCTYTEIDEELSGADHGNGNGNGNGGDHENQKQSSSDNAVASTLVSALARMLQPSLASVSVRFVSKTDGSVLPEDKIRLASRLPLTIVNGKRVVVFAVASNQLPACTILVTGLIGTEQQSFSTDFTVTKSQPNNDATSPTSTFNLNYIAAVQARLNLVEVFTVRTTLKEDQSDECRRLAGTTRLPSNTTAISTRTEQSANDWRFGLVHYGWLPLARRCNILPPYFLAATSSSPSSPVKVVASANKKNSNNSSKTAAKTVSASPLSASQPTVEDLPPLNKQADPFLNYSSSTAQASRDSSSSLTNATVFGDITQGFIKTQKADGLWESKSELVWNNLLARAASTNNNNSTTTITTIDQLRGSAASTSRRPGSASDLAAARWLAALVIVSIETSKNQFEVAIGSLAVKKARAALKNDEALLNRARQVLVGGGEN